MSSLQQKKQYKTDTLNTKMIKIKQMCTHNYKQESTKRVKDNKTRKLDNDSL